jgi:hypothetical protein
MGKNGRYFTHQSYGRYKMEGSCDMAALKQFIRKDYWQKRCAGHQHEDERKMIRSKKKNYPSNRPWRPIGL